MCATLTGKGESVLFRSFTPYADAKPVSSEAKEAYEDGEIEGIDISTASRATSAAPTYLPEVPWKKMTFWDGGLLNNNPIHQLWAARYDTTDSPSASAPVVGCVLSLGTSWSRKQPSSIFRFFNTVTNAASYMTNTEAKHRDFERELNRLRAREPANKNTKYFRFNTPTDDVTFNLDDYQQMDELEKITKGWLEKDEQRKKIKDCADLLHPIKELD
jgi:predicted acylesterase/phospholipase RssA